MVFVLVFTCLSLALVLGAWWLMRKRKPTIDFATYSVLVSLHQIRRRLDVFLFKVEVERRAQRAERQLSKELRDLRPDEHGAQE